MIHFVENPEKIPALRENLEIARSMVETALPEITNEVELKFRRGPSILTCDRRRIILQRHNESKPRESLQASFSFGTLTNPLSIKPLHQVTAREAIEALLDHLEAAQSSNRIGSPYEQLPAELEDLFAIHALAAAQINGIHDDRVEMAFPISYLDNAPPIALVEVNHVQYRLADEAFSKLVSTIPEAIFLEISSFEDVNPSISLALSSVHFSIDLSRQVNLVDQMKALSRYKLTDHDLLLVPYLAD